jgi:tRNA(Ile)-lysidine synthase
VTSLLAANVAAFCQQNNLLSRPDKVVVGVSGGPDSLCLLHVLKSLTSQFDLTLVVAHLNHQLRGDAAQADADFVRALAADWGLPVVVESQPVADLAAARKQSIEEAARQARYAFLWRVAAAVGAAKIAVGHNADDQVETVLMHFVRGAGLLGLRGMLPALNIAALSLALEGETAEVSAKRTFAVSPTLIRPLLDTPRADIEAYCQAHHLSPRRDHTNQDTTFFRNRLRYDLLPHLETYNPNIRQVLRHTAKVITADVELLMTQTDQAWRFTLKHAGAGRVELDLFNWQRLPLALQRATLRRAIELLRAGLRDINFDHVEAAITVVEKRKTGAKATLPQGLVLTVGYDTIIIADPAVSAPLKTPHLVTNDEIPLRLPGVTPLPQTQWQLVAEILPAAGLDETAARQAASWEAYLDADKVGAAAALRPRWPGDTFAPLGLGGRRQKINEFMINEKIPAGQRAGLPLLVAAGQILWVCGYRPAETACLRPTTQRILHLKFEPAV